MSMTTEQHRKKITVNVAVEQSEEDEAGRNIDWSSDVYYEVEVSFRTDEEGVLEEDSMVLHEWGSADGGHGAYQYNRIKNETECRLMELLDDDNDPRTWRDDQLLEEY